MRAILFKTLSLTLLQLLVFTAVSQAQLSKGKKLFFKEEYRKALPVLEQVVQEDSLNAEALYYAGICHLQNYDPTTGLAYLQRAIYIQADIDQKHQAYWLGIAYFYTYQFDEAKTQLWAYKRTLAKKDQRHATLDKLLTEIDRAQNKTVERTRYWVEKIEGPINTRFSEHSPIISRDGQTLIYTSRGHKSINSKRASDGAYYEDIYRVKKQADGSWGEPEKINQFLHAKRHDASCQLFDNDRKMMIYRFENDGDLMISQQVNGEWSDAKSLPSTINTRFYESHGFITSDGSALYFASNRGNVKGDLDLYVSKKNEAGQWGEATKLGNHINSPYDDDAPFVSEDGKTLYFSSRGHNSKGGFDMFSCEWNERTKSWGAAKNMGEPINTTEDDIYMVWEKGEQQGYFASNRLLGKGEKDIYRFGKTHDVILKGIVYGKESKQPLENVILNFKHPLIKETYRIKTGKDGAFQLKIASNAAFLVEASLYFEKHPDISAFDQDSLFIPLAKTNSVSIHQDFYLQVPSSTIRLAGSVKDAKSRKPLSGTLYIKDKKSNKSLQTIQITAGYYQDTLQLLPGDNCSITIEIDGKRYEELDSFFVTKSRLIRKNFNIQLPVTEKDSDLLATGRTSKKAIEKPTQQTTVKKTNPLTLLNTIYFDLNDADLDDQDRQELDQVVGIMQQYPRKKISLAGHADTKGEQAYNLTLSKKRVDRVFQYLVSHGIDTNRISIAHFGEYLPTAPQKGSDAETDDDQKLNRRVEIIDLELGNYLKKDQTLLVLKVTNPASKRPVNGRLLIRAQDTKAIIAKGILKNGRYKIPLKLATGKTYTIDFKESPKAPPYSSLFIAPQSGVIYREIKIDKRAEENRAKEALTADKLTKTLSYTLNAIEMSPEAIRILDKWIRFLKEHKEAKIELISHTNPTGNRAYNIAISQLRMKTASDYLAKNGIPANRIHKKLWFGEASLADNCKEGIDCQAEKRTALSQTEIRLVQQ